MRYAALPSVWIGAFQVLDEHFVGINSLVGKDATMVVLIECGGVAEWFRQGPAKPCTGVRIPSPPRHVGCLELDRTVRRPQFSSARVGRFTGHCRKRKRKLRL